MIRVTPIVLLLICMALTLISACKRTPTDDLTTLDLLSHGMPIVIRAPENPSIRKMDLAMMKDITVIKGKDYNLQIFESDMTSRDIGEIKRRLATEVSSNRYFSKFLQDDTAGFVYETQVDSNYINYGFRHVRLQGDKEYIFQQGLGARLTLEAVQIMYEAVQ